MLDFDGTLAPLRRARSRVRMGRRWSRVLGSLANRAGISVAVVSGRGLADLRRQVKTARVLLVGNHGSAWSRPLWGPSRARLAAWRRRVRRALPAARALAQEFPGLDVEDKGLNLCFQVRGVAPRRRERLALKVRAWGRRLGLRTMRGRAVLEWAHPAAWDKGDAVLRIWRRGGRGACLFAGDDVTDEDAFKALEKVPQSVRIKVGTGPTRAPLRMNRTRLLARLRGLLKERPFTGGPHVDR